MDYHRPTVGYFKENYVLVHGECCCFWENTKIKKNVIKKKDGLDGLDFESKPKSESRESKSESKSKSRELESKSAESKKVDLSLDSTSSPDSSPPALLHNYGDI